jgi:DNA (cytosine-5)-methyltransferase 1
MRELALFAGAGGGLLGSRILGWSTVCAVEVDPYARSVLFARQRDGHLERFPVWDDIRTFKGAPWRGTVDVVSGGFPCQDISSAGQGRGLAGARSGLWHEMRRVVDEVRPRFVFAENSSHLRTRGLGTVIDGLARLGYDARWCVLGARHVGAPHRRDRMWILAYSNDTGQRVQSQHVEMGGPLRDVDTSREYAAYRVSVRIQHGRLCGKGREEALQLGCLGKAGWYGSPPIARMDDGLAHRLDRTRVTGNGQVPAVAALAWEVLSSGL